MHALKLADTMLFLSTLSLRRATWWLRCWQLAARISIHALLAESDAIYPSSTPPKEYFYPRSPCGERLLQHFPTSYCKISIHALLAESDRKMLKEMSIYVSFLSTLSLRRATTLANNSPFEKFISIHALLAESDLGPTGRPA